MLFSAATLFAARVGGTQKENTLLLAKALAYTQVLGSKAREQLLAEHQKLEGMVKKLGTHSNVSKVTVSSPGKWEEKATKLQSSLDKTVQESGTTSAVGKLRVSGLVLIANTLGFLVGAASAGSEMDPRTKLETTGQYLELMGMFRNLRATLCEEMVFKSMVTVGENSVITVAQFAKGTTLDKLAANQLKELRRAAGRYTIAGSLVLVGFDVVDGWRALKENNFGLATAYAVRAAGGTLVIVRVGIGMYTVTLEALGVRLNQYAVILIAIGTVGIEIFNNKLWEDWLRSQPFRTNDDKTDGSLIKQFQQHSHQSEAQMLSALKVAIDKAKKG